MKAYETVIGLEVHVELATKTKIFCSCSTEFGGAPNTHTCPVCTGMPGSLPVLNKQVVEYAMAVGLATNCDITRNGKFDRKNYFYPDIISFHFQFIPFIKSMYFPKTHLASFFAHHQYSAKRNIHSQCYCQRYNRRSP